MTFYKAFKAEGDESRSVVVLFSIAVLEKNQINDKLIISNLSVQ